jgi:hypothetical protein
MAISHSAQPGRHPLAVRGLDLYETPPEATRALLNVEQLPRVIWEPAAGRGAIADVLRARGHRVIARDIHDYGAPSVRANMDFLKAKTAPPGCETIVTNPPYNLAEAFVVHALRLVPRSYMLLRLAFLESERRSAILDRGRLLRVHVFKQRLPMMHRDGWTGRRASSAIAFAWFVWDRDYRGTARIDRISWRSC